MLHIEVSRLWSKGIISVYTDARCNYDHETKSIVKEGANLKKGDKVFRQVDPDGNMSTRMHTWKVADTMFTTGLRSEDLTIGAEYGVFVRSEENVVPFKLVVINLDLKMYYFRSMQEGVDDIECHASNLPSIYPKGANRNAHSDVHTVVLESETMSSGGGFTQDEVPMEVIRNEKFVLDIGMTHVVEAIG